MNSISNIRNSVVIIRFCSIVFYIRTFKYLEIQVKSKPLTAASTARSTLRELPRLATALLSESDRYLSFPLPRERPALAGYDLVVQGQASVIGRWFARSPLTGEKTGNDEPEQVHNQECRHCRCDTGMLELIVGASEGLQARAADGLLVDFGDVSLFKEICPLTIVLSTRRPSSTL